MIPTESSNGGDGGQSIEMSVLGDTTGSSDITPRRTRTRRKSTDTGTLLLQSQSLSATLGRRRRRHAGSLPHLPPSPTRSHHVETVPEEEIVIKALDPDKRKKLKALYGGAGLPTVELKQSWMDAVPRKDLASLRKSFTDVDPISFFAGTSVGDQSEQNPSKSDSTVPQDPGSVPQNGTATSTADSGEGSDTEDNTATAQRGKSTQATHEGRPVGALCVVQRAHYEGIHHTAEGERGVVRYKPILAAQDGKSQNDNLDLAEEGYFVGLPPPVPAHRLRSTERRLRNATTLRHESSCDVHHRAASDDEDGSKEATNINNGIDGGGGWFEPDGSLKQLPDPLVPYPQRLPLTGVHAQLVGHHQTADPRVQFQGAITSDPSSVARPHLYTLDIAIASVVFTDHELSLQEHRLARQLEGLVECDRKRCDDKPAELLTHKLAALRRAKAKAEESLRHSGRMTAGPDELSSTMGLSQAEASAQRLRDRCESYRKEIRDTRAGRDAEIVKDLSIKESIIKTWNELKSVRVQQQFASTPHQIRVFQEPTDEDDDRAQMTADLKHELEELQEEYEDAMAQRRHAHREELALQVQRLRIENADPNDIAQIDLDSVPAELTAPFDKKKHRKRIAARLRATRRPPGTPLIMVTLTLGGAVTSDAECPRAERWRRDHVRRWRVRVGVSVNGRSAIRTRAIPLAQDFTADVREDFHIQLHEAPREVVLDVVQCGGGGRGRNHGHLAQVYAPVPTQGLVTPADEHELVFSCPHRTRHEDAGDGGAVLDVDDADDDDMGVGGSGRAGDAQERVFHTSGVLACTLHWAPSDTPVREATYYDEGGGGDGPGRNDRFHGNAAVTGESDAVGALGAGGIRDVKLLRKWLRDAHIDPKDPTNAYLLRHLRDDRVAGGDMRIKYYRLCSDVGARLSADGAVVAGPETHKRERLLELRQKEVPGFNDEVVPLREDDIAEDVFKKLERRTHAVGAAEGLNEPEWRRSAQAQFLKEIREEQMVKQQQLRSRRELHDVVHDNLFPSHTSSLIAALKSLFGGQGVRPLRPRPRPVKKLAPVHTPERCDVIIRIARAWGLPHRVRVLPGVGAGSTQNTGPHFSETLGRTTSPTRGLRASGRVEHKDPVLLDATDVELRPFVEVAFQSEIQATSTVTGTSPSWNEEIVLPFTPPGNNYSPESLLACEDSIFFHVYDQVYVDILEDEDKRHTDIHKRRERRWLGSFSVPIATVYTNQQVDGTFRIAVPFALLGYAPAVKQGVAVQSYISVFITVAPQLQTALKNITTTDSYEEEQLLSYAKHWRDAVTKRRPDIDANPLTQDMYGLSVLITRYVHPQIPPRSVVDPGHVTSDNTFLSMRRLARFVAMIPERNDSSLFVGHADLWTTSAQMFQMMGADDEEHAMLLCNYFLTLPDVDAHVVIGKGIPRGRMVYVMSTHLDEAGTEGEGTVRPNARAQSDDDDDDDTETPQHRHRSHGKIQPVQLFWDALSGEHFPVNDTLCPLRRADIAFNESNIWANMQTHELSASSFDLSKPGIWKPFFDKKFPKSQLASVQVDQLLYEDPVEAYKEEIETMLTTKLQASFSGWRPRHVTRWNRHCSKVLKATLVDFEEAWITAEEATSPAKAKVLEALNELSQAYKIVGIPLNFPFTTYSDAANRIHNTNMHCIEDKHVEYALAVHAHAYPNKIFSVWVYIASVQQTRR
eukprot:m.1020787 g.1020787  ORF g.1020787 m.1020787 type:complete len:1691 (+) comp24091_c0_seq1:222-5294(+)